MDNNPSSPQAKPHYEFWAFISYSRKDKASAKKLHEFIETYGVPVELVEQHTTPLGEAAPARLHPCFRDIDDLPSDSSVSKALREKLVASRFLVVVCSPNSAASMWVDKEIKEFRALHGKAAEDRIHAFIIAGNPNPEAIDCCFPPSLRHQDPCALNATELGEGDRIAKLKLIAAMLGVPPDAIIRRDQERRMKRMKLAVAVALLLVSVLSWLWWRASVARDAEEIAKNKAQAALIAADEARKAEKTAKERAISAEAMTAEQLKETTIQKQRAVAAEAKTAEQLRETQRQLERSWLEEGRAWLERAKAAKNNGENLNALMLAGRAVGYQGFGRQAVETPKFQNEFPVLLGNTMHDAKAEADRLAEVREVMAVSNSVRVSLLPLWSSPLPSTFGKRDDPASSIDAIAFSPDGLRLACGARDGTVRMWDAASGKELAILHGHSRDVSCVAFSPNGTLLASCSLDGTIKLWEIASSKEFLNLQGPTDDVTCVAFSPDGRVFASGSRNGFVALWDLFAGKEMGTKKLKVEQLRRLEFNSDGSRLLCEAYQKLPWEVIVDTDLAKQDIYVGSFAGSVAYSPDGSKIANSTSSSIGLNEGRKISLADSSSGTEIGHLLGGADVITDMAFSPDGLHLASVDGNTVRLWDLGTGKIIATLREHLGLIKNIAFSPDGKRLGRV